MDSISMEATNGKDAKRVQYRQEKEAGGREEEVVSPCPSVEPAGVGEQV